MSDLKSAVKGISNLALLILLVAFAVIGAVLSYMWTEAYYIEAGFRVPEGVVTVTISNVTFPIQNASYFDLTVLTPSFSFDDAYIERIIFGRNVSSEGLDTVLIIPAEKIEPSIPYPLAIGEEVTFKCNQNWGPFAGEPVYVVVLLQDGSGATFPFQTEKVKLEIVDVEIDTTKTIERFNITIQNAGDSLIPLNITEVLFDTITIPSQNITASSSNTTLPLQLFPGEMDTLICNWNLWKEGALGFTHALTIETAQSYSAVHNTETLPKAVSLDIAETIFAHPHTDSFNITIVNQQSSLQFVDVDRITIRNGTQTFDNITLEGDPRRILPGNNYTYQCIWSWEAFKDQEVEITVHTTQGFYIKKTVQISSTFGTPIADFEYSPIPSYTGNVTFNATKSYDTHGSIIEYFWDFGDGTNGTGIVVTHNYIESNNFSVSLTVTDNDGLINTKHINLTILNQQPIASFSESTEIAYVGEPISFNASASYDPDGSIVSYFWDFGDGTNSTGIEVSHAFSITGNYTVTLTVTDDDGATDTAQSTKTILNNPPIAIFTESAETALINEVITFNASDSYDPDGTIVNYFWDFGDGSNDTGVSVNHLYSANGTFIVTLTITDNEGSTSSVNATKTIMNISLSTLSDHFELESYPLQNIPFIQLVELNHQITFRDKMDFFLKA